uniref:G_PROTEIN_RECEP_F1_2 domain-containing protein n=1 Tax=Angiostrongylus cantonensis TaxID=6313 RepID=A0A0K0DPG4_ANGCA
MCIRTVFISRSVMAVNPTVVLQVGVVLLFGGTPSVPRQILFCILVICCADLLVLCDLSLLVHFQLSKQWMFGDAICKLFYCVEVLNKFLIPVALVHISRASYNSLSKLPLFLIKKITLQLCKKIIFVGYFSSTNTHWIGDKAMTVCNFNPPTYYEIAFNSIAFLVGYVMTSVGYVYFYANVPIILKRRYSSNVFTTAGNRTRINSQSILRIRRIVTVFVVVYLACWTPYWILFCFLSMVEILHRFVLVVQIFGLLFLYPLYTGSIHRQATASHCKGRICIQSPPAILNEV